MLTFDGVGEWSTATWGVGRGNRIELSHALEFPHSLGLLYTAFTTYVGFRPNADEYKLMGLAPYGDPIYVDRILESLVDLRDDGSFRLDARYFDFIGGLRMTSKRFYDLFGGPPRVPETPIERRHIDVAASIQKVVEEIVLRTARFVHAETGMRNLCLSGGVALNCVANGRLQREGPFERIWIQPAAGDAGSALGVALLIWHQLLDRPRVAQDQDSVKGSLLGTAYSDESIRRVLDERGATYSHFPIADELTSEVAKCLADGDVVGWFQGRMEFGPRALGARSILGDPRRPDMQRLINQKVKFREGFRPFAPAVLREFVDDYFALGPEGKDSGESPYMLIVGPVRDDHMLPLSPADAQREGLALLDVDRSTLPAVTHVDGSARVQTVDLERRWPLSETHRIFPSRNGMSGAREHELQSQLGAGGRGSGAGLFDFHEFGHRRALSGSVRPAKERAARHGPCRGIADSAASRGRRRESLLRCDFERNARRRGPEMQPLRSRIRGR